MFVTFEGIEGAGKSTAINYLAGFLQENGHDPLCTREPGGCALGRSLRSILLDARTRELSSRAELFLFLADRAQHVAEIIRPALEAGQTVLCDRYTDSTLAYQGHGRGLDTEYLRRLNQAASGGLQPDLTLLLDLPVPCGRANAIGWKVWLFQKDALTPKASIFTNGCVRAIGLWPRKNQNALPLWTPRSRRKMLFCSAVLP